MQKYDKYRAAVKVLRQFLAEGPGKREDLFAQTLFYAFVDVFRRENSEFDMRQFWWDVYDEEPQWDR